MNANAQRQDPSAIAQQRRDYRKLNPEKRAAHHAVQQAIDRGDLRRRPCERCGDQNTDGHHENYGKPLEVIWLCRLHHRQRHKELRAVA